MSSYEDEEYLDYDQLNESYQERIEKEEENRQKIRDYLSKLSEEEYEELIEFEFYEEWILREGEFSDMSIEEFDEMMCINAYGLTDEELGMDED